MIDEDYGRDQLEQSTTSAGMLSKKYHFYNKAPSDRVLLTKRGKNKREQERYGWNRCIGMRSPF